MGGGGGGGIKGKWQGKGGLKRGGENKKREKGIKRKKRIKSPPQQLDL